MPNMAQQLKDEMSRIGRREAKKAIAVLERSSANYRKDIAALKRQVNDLQRALKISMKKEKPTAAGNEQDSSTNGKRFSAEGLRKHRHRLGLSAAQFGSLLGVSEQSIYNWETKVAKPRASYLPAIVKLRGMGKREAVRLLDAAAQR